MYTSAFNSDRPMEMKLFCGSCPSGDELPVVGRLCFSGARTPSAETDACILVADGGEAVTASGEERAALIVLGEPPLCEELTGLPYPVLLLSELSRTYHGRIALLDPAQGLLFISPDLMTLDRYSERLGAADGRAEVSSALLSDGSGIPLCALLPSETEGVEGGLLESPSDIGEDGAYDYYRDAAEGAVGLPLTAVLDLSVGEEPLRMQLRGLFRSAVYGSFSCLIRGILTDEDARRFLNCAHRCFCELESEGREFNGYIKKGLLVDTPLLLYAPISTDGLDFLCIDLPTVIRRLVGREDRTDESVLSVLEEALTELTVRAKALPLSMIANGSAAVTALLPRLLPLGVQTLFVPSSPVSTVRQSRSPVGQEEKQTVLLQKNLQKNQKRY